jgi:hypothetical protein
MRLIKQVRGAAVAALTATALAVWAPPALATGPEGEAVDAAEIASEATETAVGPQTSDVLFGEAPSGQSAVVADTGAMEVVAPVDAAKPIVIGTGDDDSLDIGIGLPVTASAKEVEVVEGDAVYLDAEAQTSFVVDAGHDGARIVSVLHSPESPHEIGYSLDIPDEVTATVNAEGGVDLLLSMDEQSAALSLGGFEAPWAVDAEGARQDTWYEMRGDQLVQVVRPSPSAEYPLSADPSYYVCTPGGVSVALCIKLTRAETTSAAARAANVGVAGAAAYVSESVCGRLPTSVRIRGVRLNPRALCKGIVAAYAAKLISTAVFAASQSNRCVEIRAFTFVGLPIGVLDPVVVRRC